MSQSKSCTMLHVQDFFHAQWYFIVICTWFSFCIAFFFFDRHVANGEILGVSLLMEDVLQTGYQDISHLSDADDLETARSEKKEGSVAPSRGPSRLDIQTPTGSISSKAGINQWRFHDIMLCEGILFVSFKIIKKKLFCTINVYTTCCLLTNKIA